MALTLKEEIAGAIITLAHDMGWTAVVATVPAQTETSIKTSGKATLLVRTAEGDKSIIISRSLRAEIANN